MKRINYLIAILFLIFLLPSVLGSCTRNDPILYVNDDGDATNCPGYDYTSIAHALSDNPSCARIYVCDGTYNEQNIFLNNTNGIILKGLTDNGSVKIKGIFDLSNSSDIYLKDFELLDVTTGIYGIDSEDITLENITVSNITNTSALNYGIYFSNVSNLKFKGDIVIDGVEAKDFSYGIYLMTIDNLDISSLNLLDVSGINSTSSNSISMGISFDDVLNTISTNALFKVLGISSDNSAVGILFSDISGTFNGELDVSIVNGDTGVNGIAFTSTDEVIDTLVFNDYITSNFIISNNSDSYGIVINNFQDVTFSNSVEVKNQGALNKVYGIQVKDSEVKFDDTLEFSSFISQNENLLTSLNIDSSVVDAFDIYDSVNSLENHKVVNVINSSVFMNDYFNVSTNHDTCYNVSGNSLLFLSHQTLDNCAYKFYVNDGVAIISDSGIDPTTGIFLQPGSNSGVGEIDSINYVVEDYDQDPISEARFVFYDTETKEVISYSDIENGKVSFPRFEKKIEDGETILNNYLNLDIGIIAEGFSSVYLENQPFPQLNQSYSQTIYALPYTIDPMEVTKTNDDVITFNSFPYSNAVCDSSLEDTLFCMDINKPFYENNYAFKSAKITLKLPINLLNEYKVPLNGISIKHFENNNWEDLDVTYVKEFSGYRYYSFETDSFSTFAVIGTPASCIVDSDCAENYVCNLENVCECNLTCASGEVLDQANCVCETESSNPDDSGSDGSTGSGTDTGSENTTTPDTNTTLPTDTNTEQIIDTSVNDTNLPEGVIDDSIDDTNTENLTRGNNTCDITCPENTLLDQERCVCIAQSPTNNLGLYILLGLIAIILVIGGIYVLNYKTKPTLSKSKPKNKVVSKDSKKEKSF